MIKWDVAVTALSTNWVCVRACVCARALTVDLVVWRQQSDVWEGDAAGVAVVKLHRDEIIILVNIGTSCLVGLGGGTVTSKKRTFDFDTF